MQQIKPNYLGGANFEGRTVKDIIEPAKSISNKVSVKAALDQMPAHATDSARAGALAPSPRYDRNSRSTRPGSVFGGSDPPSFATRTPFTQTP